jgi:hypothetical protein
LEKYYHTDVFPERIPLRIVKNDLINSDIKLKKFDENVIFIEKNDTEPYLSFPVVNIETNSAYVEFEYPPEGIRGNANLINKNGNWEINKLIIHEK